MLGINRGGGIKVEVTIYPTRQSAIEVRKLNWVLKAMPKSKQLAEAFTRATAAGMAPVH